MGPITAIGHIFGRFHYHLLCFPAVFRQYHEAVNAGTTQRGKPPENSWRWQQTWEISQYHQFKVVLTPANRCINPLPCPDKQNYEILGSNQNYYTQKCTHCWFKYVSIRSQTIPYHPILSQYIPMIFHCFFSWSLTALRLQTLSGRRES